METDGERTVGILMALSSGMPLPSPSFPLFPIQFFRNLKSPIHPAPDDGASKLIIGCNNRLTASPGTDVNTFVSISISLIKLSIRAEEFTIMSCLPACLIAGWLRCYVGRRLRSFYY